MPQLWTECTSRFRFLLILTLIGAAFVCSCADPAVLEEEDSIYKLLDGERTNAHPAIGKLELELSDNRRGLCTGTLVAPSVVLTAAHCVSYESKKRNFGKFVVYRKGTKSYEMDAAISFSANEHLGPHDLALIHLKKAVPQKTAKPLSIAQQLPSDDTPVEIFGFGCTDREDREGSGKKQAFGFNYGDITGNLCPGDSGGPVVVPATKEIIHVNSAYYTSSGDDIFGIPSYMYATLTRAIQVLDEEGKDAGLDEFGDLKRTKAGKPKKFKVQLQEERAVRLSWEPRDDLHLNFELARRKLKRNGSWAEPVILGYARHGWTYVVDRSLETGGTFEFRVRALNSVGKSGWTGWKQLEVQ